MKREIKFRGKANRMNGSAWIYGDLRYHKIGVYIFKQEGLGGEEVKPETIGQFTGLCDKNGKEIYEGDIISVELSDNSVIYKLVKYIPERASYCMACTIDLQFESKWDIWGRISEKWVADLNATIVGNIHDNPELLEK